jgi:hypothetical protein
MWPLRHAYRPRRRPVAFSILTVRSGNYFTSRILIVTRSHDRRLRMLTDATRSMNRVVAEQLPQLGVAAA